MAELKLNVKDGEKLGRTITKILRHTAVECGLEPSKDGFVSVEKLLKIRDIANFHCTKAILQHVIYLLFIIFFTIITFFLYITDSGY
jgi:RNA:NAD 2'-phosphotransferase (TPT1/KptA family)